MCAKRSYLKLFINVVPFSNLYEGAENLEESLWESNWDFLPVHDTTLGNGYNGKWV